MCQFRYFVPPISASNSFAREMIMDSRPVNHVSFFPPKYMPPRRDPEEDKRKKTGTKTNRKAEPEDNESEASLPDDLGSQIDTVA